jgi:hypothetical protein
MDSRLGNKVTPFVLCEALVLHDTQIIVRSTVDTVIGGMGLSGELESFIPGEIPVASITVDIHITSCYSNI